MMSANDMVVAGMMLAVWHTLIVLVVVFSLMFIISLAAKLHNMAKAELDELCISTSGRDCESDNNRGSV